MSNADLLNPDHTPETKIKKLNKLPMLLVVGVILVIFITAVIIISSTTDETPNREQTEQITAGEGNSRLANADDIIGDRRGIINNRQPTLPPPVYEGQKDLDAPPAPPVIILGNDTPAPPQQNIAPPVNEYENFRQQMYENALIAGSGIQKPFPAGSSTRTAVRSTADYNAQVSSVRSASTNPVDAYNARLEQARAIVGATENQSQYFPENTGSSIPVNVDQFSGSSNRWNLNSRREASSRYEVKTGFVIPATLVTGINSEIQGQVQAQVSQNVYDSATGHYLLIPQGSKLIGEYVSNIAYGQNRIMIAWQRVIFPDSSSLDIGAMAGADQAGYSGFEDQVNHHYFRLFGSAVLMSGIIAGVNLSQDSNSTGDRQRASDAMSEALGNQLGQVTAQLINKNLNISPTINIRPGYRFNVIVTKDLIFTEPYTPRLP